MSAQGLAVMWLRDRAENLRTAAQKMDGSYSDPSGMAYAARYVADKYRKAAVLLDDAATEAEDDDAVMSSMRREAV